jgi:predicted amidohydrolase YtcJ
MPIAPDRLRAIVPEEGRPRSKNPCALFLNHLSSERRFLAEPRPMRHERPLRLRFAIALSLLGGGLGPSSLPGREPASGPADLVIQSARVFTLDSKSSVAEAVAVQGQRILRVGTNREISELVGPATTIVDARGKSLLPGLYDSHVHPLGAASSEADHPIPVFESLDDLRRYIQQRARVQPPGTWIIARYAFPTRLAESRFLTRAELDEIAPDHMVMHQGGPAGVVNSKALADSGITRDTPDPPAGTIVRDPATGEPTGMLRNAYSALRNLPKNAYGDNGPAAIERVRELFRRYNQRGITSIGDRGASDEALAIYRTLRDRGELTVRVNATRILSPPFGDRSALAARLNQLARADHDTEPNGPTGAGDHWVRIGPLKVFIDGGMLNGTALMREPWGVGETYQITDPDYRGLRFIPAETLAAIAEEAARRGWQMTAHCAGEAGMDALLDAYQIADQTVGIRHLRWLITHANFTSADNLQRCRQMGINADLQPAWLWKDARTLLRVLGPRRMEWFHPYRRWLDAGLVIGGGSDHMIRLDPLRSTNPWDPWLGIWVAVSRRYEGGETLHPDQRLSRIEALRFYTLNNAYLHFEERDRGSIEPGKLADLIIIDRNPLTCPEDDLKETKVLATILGGRFVWRAD